jgi:hypothetical protein
MDDKEYALLQGNSKSFLELIKENSSLKAKEQLEKNAGLLLEACEEALSWIEELWQYESDTYKSEITTKLESAIRKAKAPDKDKEKESK